VRIFLPQVKKKVPLKKWMIDLLIDFMEYRWRDRRKSMGIRSVRKFINMAKVHGKKLMTEHTELAMNSDWIGIRYQNFTKSDSKAEELNRSKLIGDKWDEKNRELEKMESNGG